MIFKKKHQKNQQMLHSHLHVFNPFGVSCLIMCSVIVSQWTSMLHIVAVHLKTMGLRYGVIDGTVNPKRRMDLVEEFNTNPKGPQVSPPQKLFK